ncbi:MAG: prepilin-type N-terminal cleavage/methylation domain-containing protein [Deltaproteobacteria bacterium]|jgi:general secretion pathway protein G|nr:prepilin-type N-terminal cleavage/methylation domain-containing protein [Deltaproteobacteria bacterium]MBW2534103.1 prepilin-type N-terminal cleavage/methylation domain-containing protein [Deltaproteobacteria bacterium]
MRRRELQRSDSDTLTFDPNAFALAWQRWAKARRRGRQRCVTLVEVLIVVAIMALIAGGVSFMILPKYRQAQIDTANTTARTIRQAATMWRSLKGGAGECPTVSVLIEEKEIDPSSTTEDPWGQPFTISCSEDDVTVSSPGPDGKEGSKDDISIGPGGGGGEE